MGNTNKGEHSPAHSIPTPPAAGPRASAPHSPKWAEVDVSTFKFDYNTPPANVDATLDWGRAEGCSKGADGSVGVMFVKLAQGAVVLKGSTSLASEVFATSVARALGIPGPRMRIVVMRGEEGQKIRGMVKRLDPLLSYMVDSRYVLVMEYLVGTTLKSIDHATFKQFIAAQDNKTVILRQIGALAAMDVLLNNSDRVPLVAQNEGNPGNLMFSKRNGHVISLDNSIVSLKGNTLAKYVEKVVSVLGPICSNPSEQSGLCKGIGEVIEQYTGYELGESGLVHLQEGIAQCVVECTVKLDMEVLMKTKNMLRTIDEKMVGLDLIEEEFLEIMLLVFKHVQASEEPLDYGAVCKMAQANLLKRSLLEEQDPDEMEGDSEMDVSTSSIAGESKLQSPVRMMITEEKASRTSVSTPATTTAGLRVSASSPASTSPTSSTTASSSSSSSSSSTTTTTAAASAPSISVSSPSSTISTSPSGLLAVSPPPKFQKSLANLNQQISQPGDTRYEECFSIKNYGEAILIARSLVISELKGSAVEKKVVEEKKERPATSSSSSSSSAASSSSSSSSSSATSTSSTVTVAVCSSSAATAVAVESSAPSPSSASSVAVVVTAKTPATNEEIKTQGKTLLEIARCLVVVESSKRKGVDDFKIALSDVTHQLQLFTSLTSPSVPIRRAVQQVSTRLLALLIALQRHCSSVVLVSSSGASASSPSAASSPTAAAAAVSSSYSVQKCMSALESAYNHLRLACNGLVLDESSTELVRSSVDMLQKSLLEMLSESKVVQEKGVGRNKKRTAALQTLRGTCQTVFATAKSVCELFTDLTPLLLSKSHYNQAILALNKVVEPVAGAKAAAQAVQDGPWRPKPGLPAALDQLTSALDGVASSASLVNQCTLCAEAEGTFTGRISERLSLCRLVRDSADRHAVLAKATELSKKVTGK